MTVFRDANQVGGTTLQIGYSGLPAGTTLLRAKLAMMTSFDATYASGPIGYAPPNTLAGIYWAAAGVSPPLITAANIGNAEWYAASYGEFTVIDQIDEPTVAGQIDQRITWHYASTIDKEAQNYQATSFELGLSINFLGGGFWPVLTSYITYDFTAWYT